VDQTVTTIKKSFYSNWSQKPNQVWSKSWPFDPTIKSSWILDCRI